MNDETRQAVGQWRKKAQSDWATVEILLSSEQRPADTVCFHCQQFVEKLLKAVLTLHDIEAPKTHDVRRLMQLAEPFVPELCTRGSAADALTVHGVETSYPGDWPEIELSEMNEVVELSKKFGDILLRKLDE